MSTGDGKIPECSNLEVLSDYGFLFRKATGDLFRTCCAKHRCFLVDACIPAMLQISQRYASNTCVMIEISKALARLMIILNEEGMIIDEKDEEKMFDFVCKFWDYVSEAVCHDCVSIFESLIKMHLSKIKSTTEQSLSQWAINIGRFLIDSPSSCRSRYRCILAYHKIMASLLEGFTEDFCKELYSLLINPTLVVVVSELIVFDVVKNFGNAKRRQLHSDLLHTSLQSPIKAIRNAVQERLLPVFARNALLLDWIVEGLRNFQGNPLDKIGLETPLYIAKFCVFHQKGNGNVLDWTSFVDEKVVISALFNANIQIRLMAWNLICDHPKLVAPITSRQLLLCKCFLATNMAEQSPAVRLTILAGLKKILIRIREIGQNILKSGDKNDELEPFVNFIYSLRDLCFESLVEYANFSRRIMALRILEYLFLESHLVNNDKDLFFKFLTSKLRPTEEQIRHIIRCLDDSYQLCQISALRLLASSFFEIDNFDFGLYLVETKQQMFSVRSLFTLTSSYRLRFYLQKNPNELRDIFQYLVNICRERIRLITDDFLMIATNEGFVYSILSAIVVVLELLDFQSTRTDVDYCVALINDVLLSICFEISELVAPVVNSMSPEGFVPDDHIKIIVNLKDCGKLKESTDFCQLLLASCWRSHKYVSAIFHIIVTKFLGNCMLPLETVRHISDYYWRQLTECRHCGAIETAVEGFEALCAKLWSFISTGNSEFKLYPEPEAWMEQIIGLLSSEKNLLCATRRSAGLPHLVVSILATEPSINNTQCLKRAMTSLLETEGRSFEAQVHSINIMRAVFLDSRLSESVLCYLEWAMNFCFACFGSDCWAVRSAASQLFAALITRMFGVPRSMQRSLYPHQKNRLSSFEFFTRFPSLYDPLHRQFHGNQKSVSQPRMFAVLILLTHLFPSPRHAGTYSLTTYILPVLKVLLSCHAMKLRELAAAALISICEIQDTRFLLEWISEIDFNACTQNEICAIMLMLIEFAGAFDGSDLRSLIQTIVEKIENGKYFDSWCDYNRSLFLLLLRKINYKITSSMEKYILSDAVLVFRPLARWIAREVEGGEIPSEFKNLLMNNSALRFEFWHTLTKSSTIKFNDIEMMRLAIEDLRDSRPHVQRDILKLLINDETAIDRESCDTRSLKHLLHELIEMSRESNKNLAHLLLIKLDYKEWHFKWLYSCAINEDQKVQWMVVRALELLLKKDAPDIQLCKIIVLLLRNENEAIREKVAELCSHLVSPKTAPLNSEILFWWFVKYHPEVEEIVRKHGSFDSNEHTHLFDACISNPYAEAFPIGSECLGEVQQLMS